MEEHIYTEKNDLSTYFVIVAPNSLIACFSRVIWKFSPEGFHDILNV